MHSRLRSSKQKTFYLVLTFLLISAGVAGFHFYGASTHPVLQSPAVLPAEKLADSNLAQVKLVYVPLAPIELQHKHAQPKEFSARTFIPAAAERKPAELQGDAPPVEIEKPAVLTSETRPSPQPSETPQTAQPAQVAVQSLGQWPVRSPQMFDDDGSGTAVELTPFLAMTTLTSKDLVSGVHDSLASGVDAGADARYVQIWNETFKTFERGQLNYVSFSKPTSSTDSLDSTSKLLTTVGLGTMETLSSRFTLSESFDLEQNLFLRAASSTSVTTDSILIPSLGAKLSYDLMKLHAFIVTVSADYAEKMKASTEAYTVGLGHEYRGTNTGV